MRNPNLSSVDDEYVKRIERIERAGGCGRCELMRRDVRLPVRYGTSVRACPEKWHDEPSKSDDSRADGGASNGNR